MLVKIYPENPNLREIDKVVNIMRDGGLVIYPTDTVYAIGCDALNVRAVEKICQMKGVNPQKSNLSIICYDLSNLSEYAKVSNAAFKLMKKNLPGHQKRRLLFVPWSVVEPVDFYQVAIADKQGKK